MATVDSQNVRHLGRHLGFFKKFLLRKTAANFTEISRKHMFAASDMILIKKQSLKEEIRTNLSKS